MKFRLFLVFCLLLMVLPSVNALVRANLYNAGQELNARNISAFHFADLNGNSGEYDLILFDNTGSDEKLQIWCRNPGSGQGWQNDLNLSIIGGFQMFDAVDINGDIFPDLVILRSSDNNIVSYLNNGTGCPTAFDNDKNVLTGDTSLGATGRDFTPFDYDSDGRTDLAVIGTNNVRFYTGNEDGSFTFKVSESTPGTFAGHYLAVEDFNQSNWLDFLIPSTSGNRYFVNTNNAALNFDANYTSAIDSVQAWSGDLNHDGLPDVVTQGSDSGFFLATMMNNAGIPNGEDFNSDPSTATSFDSPLTHSWGADVDQDGNQDTAACDGECRFWFGTGGASFTLDLNINITASSGAFWFYPLPDINGVNGIDFAYLDTVTSLIFYDVNTQGDPNQSPNPPTADFNVTCDANVFSFAWGTGSDTETPANSLTYNMRVGTATNGNDVVSSYVSWPWKGNMLSRTNFDLNGTNQGLDCNTTIFWGIQTIDSGLKKSDFSLEQVNDRVRVAFVDENTGVAIRPDSILIDGNSFAATGGGILSIDVTNFADKEHSMVVTDSNYGARTWILDLNRNTGLSFTAAMLENARGQDINFQFFKQDDVTLFSDALVTVFTSKDELAGITRTGKNADTNFFLNPSDPGYYFRIKTNDNNVTRYNQTELLISQPKDEKTLEDLNWSLVTGGVGARSFSSLTGDLNFSIFNNTANFYLLNIDGNSEYTGRTIAIRIKGNDNNAVVQPYLLRAADDIVVSIKTIDAIDESTLRGVLVESRRFIDGEGFVLVESATTDGSGTTSFSFEAGIEYDLRFIIADKIVFRTNYIPLSTDTSKTAWLNARNITGTTTAQGIADVNFLQDTGSVIRRPSDNMVDFNIIVTEVQGTVNSVRIQVDHNGVSQSDTVDTTVSSGDQFNLSIDTTGLNTAFPLDVIVTETFSNDTNQVSRRSFGIITTGLPFIDRARDVRARDLGVTGSAMIAVLITGLMVGITSLKGAANLKSGSVFFAIAILLVFLAINWISWQALLFGSIAGTLIYWTSTRSGAV